MRIAYDISQTGSGKAGCGHFAHAMLNALLTIEPAHQYTVCPSFGDFYFDALMPVMNPYPNTHYGPRHLTRYAARQFWTSTKLEASLGQPNIIQSNNFWCPTQVRFSRVIYSLHDLGFLVNPAWSTETNRLGCFEGVFRASLAADWIVATSHATKKHFLDVFPHFQADRIRVIYQCSRFSKEDLLSNGIQPKSCRSLKPKQFWLSIGTIEPRKNQHHLIQAYARYRALGGPDIPLVLAGGKGWLMEHLQEELDKLNLTPHVILTGYLSDQEIIWLYNNCLANLYPSWFEGFGLPALEGMQFGAPTMVSNTTSLPEVVGRAGILLPPQDVEAWAQQMQALVQNETQRTELSAAARQQATCFSWNNSAQGLLHLYQEAISSPKRIHHD